MPLAVPSPRKHLENCDLMPQPSNLSRFIFISFHMPGHTKHMMVFFGLYGLCCAFFPEVKQAVLFYGNLFVCIYINLV